MNQCIFLQGNTKSKSSPALKLRTNQEHNFAARDSHPNVPSTPFGGSNELEENDGAGMSEGNEISSRRYLKTIFLTGLDAYCTRSLLSCVIKSQLSWDHNITPALTPICGSLSAFLKLPNTALSHKV